jgi:prepilin-type N-terminal cleavage/methylation domain-containing protein/prepilin-type processing-associated H-X9-DG protein
MHCEYNNHKSLSGFTLVELLVAITVILILFSLILSSVTRVKSKAQSIECINNLKQWGIATYLFAQENDDFLPKDGAPNGTSRNEGWYIDLPKTLRIPVYYELPWRTNPAIKPEKSIWICPANKRRSNGHNLFHYCLNLNVNLRGTGNRVKLSSVPTPSRVVWLFDNGKEAAVAKQNNVHTNLHNQGAQFLFLDAHAARFPNSKYWDFSKNYGLTNNPDLIWFP